MKIGVFLFATDRSADPALVAQRAEALGFESFLVPEHPILPVRTATPYPSSPDGKIPEMYARMLDPFVALARASATTRSIRLGTGICLVPERNPLLLAKEIATLDRLSGGRFLFGVGAGWLREETELMGGDFDHRWTQTRDSVMAMKALWTQEESSYEGRYYRFPPVKSFPKPLQRPHPPIFIGGTAKQALHRVVQWGDGWLPTGISNDRIRDGRARLDELAGEAGRDPKSIQIKVFGRPGSLRTRAELDALAEAGADQASVWLTQSDGGDVLAELEQLARALDPGGG